MTTMNPLPDNAADLARNGDTVGLAALLRGGLAVDAQDAKGNTLLMLASYHGKAEGVKLLLQSGATGYNNGVRLRCCSLTPLCMGGPYD